MLLRRRWLVSAEERRIDTVLGRVRLRREVPVRDRCATWEQGQGSCAAAVPLYYDSVRGAVIWTPCYWDRVREIKGIHERDGSPVWLCTAHAMKWGEVRRGQRRYVVQWVVGLSILAVAVGLAWRLWRVLEQVVVTP